ncbi:MAG: flippase [Candidatus Omnitrophica bacterium]|nr:flippase [Candidatus Omnitrophota bacterium]
MGEGFSRRFIRGVTSVSFGTVVKLLFAFVSILVAVRLVSKEEFGLFVLIQVIVYFLIVLSDFGLGVSSTKALAQKDTKDEIISTVFIFRFIAIAFLSVLILSGSRLFLFLFKSKKLVELSGLVVLFFALGSVDELFTRLLQGLHFYKKMALAEIIASLSNLLLVLVFLLVFKEGVRGLLYAAIISSSFSFLFKFFSLPVRRVLFNFALLKKLFKFGFPLQLNDFLSFIFLRVDVLMLGAMLNPMAVAIYEVSSKIPQGLRKIFESFRTVYFPHLCEAYALKESELARGVLNHSLRIISFVCLLLTLVSFLFSKEIVGFLFSESYINSAPVFTLLMLALSVSLVDNILGTSLICAGFPSKPLAINVFTTIVNLTANLILIPRFGVLGAVYATLLTVVSVNPAIVYFLKKRDIPFNVSFYLKPFFVFSMVCLLSLLGLHNVFFKLSMVVFFVLLSGLSSVITKEDLFVFIQSLKKQKLGVSAL